MSYHHRDLRISSRIRYNIRQSVSLDRNRQHVLMLLSHRVQGCRNVDTVLFDRLSLARCRTSLSL